MEFSVSVEGLDKLAQANLRVQQSIIKELKIGLYASAQRVETEAKKSILSGKKTGHIYKLRSVQHRASAPGEAPASNTGRLVNSINSYLNTLGTALESIVVAGRGVVKYAVMLEFGTAKIAPRPFMLTAFEKSRQWIKDRLARAVNDGIKKAAKK